MWRAGPRPSMSASPRPRRPATPTARPIANEGQNSMKLASIILLAATMTLPAASANAVVLDLYTMTCKQFVESDKDTISMMLTWLDGWYKGDSDEAKIDTD